jgi:fructose-1,6-bisphosphatase class II
MQDARIMQIVGVAEKAAIASSEWNGRGDKYKADQAATEAMRAAFNDIEFSGRIVIGEGERDEAPMLYIGEELGKGGEEIDIAVDPLEGTNLCAYNRPNSICTIAFAPKDSLLYAPDTYMRKLAAGPACKGKLNIDAPIAENIKIVAESLGKSISDVNVCVLVRDRNAQLIEDIYECGARVRTIDDGDVFGAIAAAVPGTGIDMYAGIGAAPEGVLACTGLKAIGGEFIGRFWFRNDDEIERARKTSGVDIDGVLTMDMLVRSDEAVFLATGVTDGEMVAGVHREGNSISTETVVMSSASRTVRFIKTIYRGEDGVVTFK